MTKLTGLLCCATLALAAIPAWAQTAVPAGAILTPQSSAGRTPTPVATAPAPAASTPGTLTPTPTTPVAAAIPRSRDDGAFAALPLGEQRVARALYGGQRPGGWSLDRVAAAHHHEGWGRVFNQMRAEGLVHGRNLGQLMREEDGREWLARHDDDDDRHHRHHHLMAMDPGEGRSGIHYRHAPVTVTTAAGGSATFGHQGHHTVQVATAGTGNRALAGLGTHHHMQTATVTTAADGGAVPHHTWR